MVAISAHLEDERGKPLVSAPDRFGVARFVSSHQANTVCLRLIDLYGETVFNRGQCVVLRAEWSALVAEAPEELIPWVRDVSQMIDRCAEEVHLYLRFSGD